MKLCNISLFVIVRLLLQMQVLEAFSISTDRTASKTALSVSTSSYSAGEMPEGSNPNRRTEFSGLEPIEESSKRQERIFHEQEIHRQFVKYGDDLWTLRNVMNKLSKKLVNAITGGLREHEEEIREQLREIEKQDPEVVYRMELEKLRKAKSKGRISDAENHGKKAMAARSCLPAYNLEGLWVGKYGHHGYEMINVTYQGDLLIAYKVTGDKNVPKGEITFQVNLNPMHPKVVGDSRQPTVQQPLQPISLTEKAAKKWGTTHLPRYRGLGQVAEPGFTNSQWMDAQLIIIGEQYFSFAWVPIEQQIFFGRPSPELALKMLRESGASPSLGVKEWSSPPSLSEDVKVLKDYVSSCLEKTAETLEEDLREDQFSCIWHGNDSEECYFQ
jgi:hypothetical protein